jgi:hypothetical protein
MAIGLFSEARSARRRMRALAACACACACALACAAPANTVAAKTGSGSAEDGLASVGECVTSSTREQRSATFSGEMAAIPGTSRMAVKIEVQERVPEEALYHTIVAPGLGVWRGSDPKVKIYKYLKQVTNLAAPASYRALVRFRWLNGHGHVIKHTEHYTSHCVQPAPVPAAQPGSQAAAGGATSTASTG